MHLTGTNARVPAADTSRSVSICVPSLLSTITLSLLGPTGLLLGSLLLPPRHATTG
jgi:hypothetical protein